VKLSEKQTDRKVIKEPSGGNPGGSEIILPV